jgi:hypothetical protein
MAKVRSMKAKGVGATEIANPRHNLRRQHVKAFGHEAVSPAHAGRRLRPIKLDPPKRLEAPARHRCPVTRQDVAGTVGNTGTVSGFDSARCRSELSKLSEGVLFYIKSDDDRGVLLSDTEK